VAHRERRPRRCPGERAERRPPAALGRSSRRLAFGGLALLGGLWALASHARPALAAELSARGPAECPDAAELTFRVERAIGMPLAHAAPVRFSVRFLAAKAGAYTAHLAVASSTSSNPPAERVSERVLGASRCTELADAVAIALALGSSDPLESGAAEPSRAGAEADAAAPVAASAASTTFAPSAPASAAAAPPDEGGDAAPTPSEPAAITPALAAWLVGDAGSLPGAGLGLGLGAELRVSRLVLRAAGTWLFDRHVALPGTSAPALGADMSLALGSLSACTAPWASVTPAALVCAGWELGRIDAIGTGVRQPRRVDALWSAPRVDFGLAWAMSGSLRFVAQLTGAVPLKRDDFFLRELGTVHRPSVVVGRLAVGVDVSFE
jgi:hypothetical protein